MEPTIPTVLPDKMALIIKGKKVNITFKKKDVEVIDHVKQILASSFIMRQDVDNLPM